MDLLGFYIFEVALCLNTISNNAVWRKDNMYAVVQCLGLRLPNNTPHMKSLEVYKAYLYTNAL